MYKRVISELAHQDLQNILAYICNQLGAPQAAKDFADAINECYKKLSRNPLMFPKCHDENLAKKGFRRALIKKYVLVYKVNEAKKLITIYRLFYGAEDYPNKM